MKSTQKLRMEIAAVAAKLVAVEGVADYHSAKRKAAIQLGLAPNRNLPTNREIENALINYQGLFQADKQLNHLKALRRSAIQAMKMLGKYRPLLVGPVATGTATSTSEIVLHLFSDHIEETGFFLSDQGIPFRVCEKQVRVNASTVRVFPAYRFIAGQTSIMLVIFSEKDKNLSPFSSVTNKPMLMLDLHDAINAFEENTQSLNG